MWPNMQAIGCDIKQHITLRDMPIHPGFNQPGLQRLMGTQAITQTMPGRITDIRH